ncbi:hypothetical protein SNS2_1888 [Streptomyces netropsis]|nr:hypothetical protein SNS2_1888 [Streptomyces netropsis]
MSSPEALITYRRGACVVDKRTGRLGELMGEAGPDVRLRPLGGGTEWACPPYELRLASPAEKRMGVARPETAPLTPHGGPAPSKGSVNATAGSSG